MDDDREIQAIAAVNSALKNLSEEERFRVIQWLANKYVQNTQYPKIVDVSRTKSLAGIPESGSEAEEEDAQVQTQTYDTFAEMLDATGADKETERFLVAAYWLQVVGNEVTWKSFEINKLLKDTGNQIESISNPVRALSKAKPALIVQVSKNSTSKGKGSKTLKLTTEGIKKIEAMLSKE